MPKDSAPRTVATRRSPLRNWLKELDQEVELAPKPTEQQRFSFFYFARYGRQKYLMLPDAVFRKQISTMVNQLSREKGVVDRLTPRQREQLAALTEDICTALETYNGTKAPTASGQQWRRVGWKWKAGRARTVASEAARRKRRLRVKVTNARSALEQLRDYAKDLDPFLGARPHVITASKCLKELESLSHEESDELEQSLRREYPVLKDPKDFCMVQLYWFFRHECGLSGDESEIRTAKIRNAFWTRYGVGQVSVQDHYQEGQSKGCDAVHQAVRRFR